MWCSPYHRSCAGLFLSRSDRSTLAPPQDLQQILALAGTFDGPALAIPGNRALVARIMQNITDRPITAPLLIVQGLADPVVRPAATSE